MSHEQPTPAALGMARPGQQHWLGAGVWAASESQLCLPLAVRRLFLSAHCSLRHERRWDNEGMGYGRRRINEKFIKVSSFCCDSGGVQRVGVKKRKKAGTGRLCHDLMINVPKTTTQPLTSSSSETHYLNRSLTKSRNTLRKKDLGQLMSASLLISREDPGVLGTHCVSATGCPPPSLSIYLSKTGQNKTKQALLGSPFQDKVKG